MKIEEAINHCEEVMIENLEKTKDRNASDPIAINCGECADNHRQLAEWLKELQAHREAWGKITAEIQDRSFENPMMNPIFTMNEIYEIIDKYRPKEGDNNDKGKSHIPS